MSCFSFVHPGMAQKGYRESLNEQLQVVMACCLVWHGTVELQGEFQWVVINLLFVWPGGVKSSE